MNGGMGTEQDGRNEANRSLMGDRPTDPLEGANCGLCGATADNFHVADDLWERVGLGHVQACFKCFRIAAWYAGIRPDPNWQVSLSPTTEYAIRNIVGRWLRTRAEHVEESTGISDYIVSKDKQRPMFQQLAADAEHSDLLVRLLQGRDPLPFEDWKRRR